MSMSEAYQTPHEGMIADTAEELEVTQSDQDSVSTDGGASIIPES
jgi:hypothetical protein